MEDRILLRDGHFWRKHHVDSYRLKRDDAKGLWTELPILKTRAYRINKTLNRSANEWFNVLKTTGIDVCFFFFFTFAKYFLFGDDHC